MTNNAVDKIAWDMLGFVKETTKKNFVTAVSSGQLKLDREILPVILTLIDSSIDEGYNKSYKNFSNRMQKLNEDSTSTSSLKKRK
jgi:hypothetical protein